MVNKLKYLLLQVRNEGDPMQAQEVACFARVLGCDCERIDCWDLLASAPSGDDFDRYDMIMLGGSGHYSATTDDPWIEPVLDSLREIHRTSKPTFASCWGFQAMTRALGGEVVMDLRRAEVGTKPLTLTAAGKADPVMGPLGTSFLGQMGHMDVVNRLPSGVVLLASSDRVENQAFRLCDQPIYCTQFHPELNRQDLLYRVRVYPNYFTQLYGGPLTDFADLCQDTPETYDLLKRFVKEFFGTR